MSALAPSLQAYFTDRLIGQRAASPQHHRRLQRRPPAPAGLRRREGRQGAQRPRHRRPRRAADRRVPGPPGTRPAQRRPQPQQPPGGHPLAVRATLALHHPEHAGSIARVLAIPAKRTERNLVTYLTDPEIDALLGSCRPEDMDRPARPCPVHAHHPDRTADLRADRAHPPGHHAQRRGQRAHRRQGQERTTHSAAARHQGSPQCLARRAARRSRRPAVSHPHRHPPQPRRHRTAPRPPPGPGPHHLPVTPGQTCQHAHAASLCGWLGYVAGSSISAGSRAARARSGHITRRRIALSVHHDQKGRFAWRQQASARHQLG